MITTKHMVLAIAFIYVQICCISALAGTAQIYSPAGLPRSSNQDYTIPETTVPVETFPTPPIPLPASGISGITSIPLKEVPNIAKPVSEPGAEQLLSPALPGQGKNRVKPSPSVNSFFQIPQAVEQKQTAAKNPAKGMGKLIWHMLDNLGVPLPISNNEDLAPELRRTYIAPVHTSQNSNSGTPIHQKIPESELGGTDIPLKDEK